MFAIFKGVVVAPERLEQWSCRRTSARRSGDTLQEQTARTCGTTLAVGLF